MAPPVNNEVIRGLLRMRDLKRYWMFLKVLSLALAGCRSSSAEVYPTPQLGTALTEAAQTTEAKLIELVKSAPLSTTPEVDGSSFYVATNGSLSGDGSIDNSWDIETAFDHPVEIKPGDTIYLRAGTYGSGGMWKVNSKLTGTSGNYITVRGMPGEEAVIDGMVDVYGGWTIFRNLRVMNSDTDRLTDRSGSNPGDIYRGAAFRIFGDNNRIINNVIHDQANGIEPWSDALNTEVYGNIVFNNGWNAPDRGHGHGIYAQNSIQSSTKTIIDNISFNNFGEYSLHIFGQDPYMYNFDVIGNVFFNGSVQIGAEKPISGVFYKSNYMWNGKARFGYSDNYGDNEDLTILDSIFVYNFDVMDLKWWKWLYVKDNIIVCLDDSAKLIFYEDSDSIDAHSWDRNSWYSNASDPFSIDWEYYDWAEWKSITGFDPNGSFSSGTPAGTDVFVRPNAYENKRGHVIIYNWDGNATVEVDISSLGFEIGDVYFFHQVQNYNEDTIEGTYDGSTISMPMTGWSVAEPIGWGDIWYPSTFPTFGVFVVEEG